MRLNKFIAHTGYCARRKADELIEKGKVSINGKKVTELGTQIDPEKDKITVNGKKLEATKKFTYVMFHKPAGTTTTRSDRYATQTIYQLLPQTFHHLHPVGRLDKESEGLLLLTDDGDFTFLMTHPKHGGKKTYDVVLKKIATDEKLERLRKGIVITEEVDGEERPYQTYPCLIKRGKDPKMIRITLREGRKRQIRKMCQKIGCPVVYLKRISMGPYDLGDLPRGDWKTIEKI